MYYHKTLEDYENGSIGKLIDGSLVVWQFIKNLFKRTDSVYMDHSDFERFQRDLSRAKTQVYLYGSGN